MMIYNGVMHKCLVEYSSLEPIRREAQSFSRTARLVIHGHNCAYQGKSLLISEMKSDGFGDKLSNLKSLLYLNTTTFLETCSHLHCTCIPPGSSVSHPSIFSWTFCFCEHLLPDAMFCDLSWGQLMLQLVSMAI